MNKLLYIIIITMPMLWASCFGKKATFDKDCNIGSFGQPIKIEFYKHLDGQTFNHKTEPEFILTDKTEIEEAMNEIQSATHPEPWKGAGWDRIIITYSDTIIKLNTNRKKIGLSASGSFYDLNKNNFITKRLDD